MHDEFYGRKYEWNEEANEKRKCEGKLKSSQNEARKRF